MDQLVTDTCRKVERWLAASANPVVLWSGGKDSTAMLHLIRFKVGAKTPVVQWREPRFRHRYAHSDMLAQAWDLEVYDWSPISYALTDGYDIETGVPRFDFVKMYEMAPRKVMFLCLGTEEPQPEELASGRYLCGLDTLKRPTGTFNFPWDAAFHGQKSADVDLIKGQVPLAQDALVQAGVPTQYYPMRHWSDADVWNYLEAEGVPNDETRYEKADGVWRHRKDKSANSDYYPVCWNCVNRHLGDTVWCPKNLCETNNISALAPYIDLQSEAQGFRPTWQDSTVNGVGHAAVTSGPGLSCAETAPTPLASRHGCFATTTH
jgi:3'-phosphoadenosine 5'-phosphosulfate sulfotransferase (PAPS reductase)/FAD synthetase